MITRISLVLAGLLLIALPASSDAIPVVTAGSDTVHVGNTFIIPISVSGVTNLTSFQFDLNFNPTIVRALSFTDIGTDFDAAASPAGGSLTGITGFIDNTTGLLSGVADSMSGIIGNGLAPAGVLVDINFRALAVGVSPLRLSNAFLTDNGALLAAPTDFVLHNGLVTVLGPATVPEPGTLTLLSVGLGA